MDIDQQVEPDDGQAAAFRVAVAAGRVIVGEALEAARLASAVDALAAADLAADQAAQDATAARYRSEGAATLVRAAARTAAEVVRRSEPDPISFGALARASEVASAVRLAASAVAEADAQLAAAVASEVAARAERVVAVHRANDRLATAQVDAVTDAVARLIRAATAGP